MTKAKEKTIVVAYTTYVNGTPEVAPFVKYLKLNQNGRRWSSKASESKQNITLMTYTTYMNIVIPFFFNETYSHTYAIQYGTT